MISNTAVPKYYGIFRDKVINGEIIVCETVSMEMNRIDDLIDNPDVYYDGSKVEGWINFCENELTLTDGSPLKLLLSFKVWGEQIYGWYYFYDKKIYRPYMNKPGGRYIRKTYKRRLINKQYLIVARAAAKTVYLACHQSYGLVVDMSTTHQVAVAPVMRQADEVLNPFRTAILKSRGPLFKFMTRGSINNTTGAKENRQMLCSTKKGIQNFLTNSILEVLPISIDKLQGLQNKLSSVDEWLSCDIKEDPIGALEQGASKLDDYLIIASSSEGTIRNGCGDSIKMELMDILKGDYVAPNVSIWWYKLDDIKEVSDPNMWMKANPNIGKTVKYETYQLDVERAEKVPSARNDIIAKRFGIPTEGYTYFFPYEETRRHKKKRSFNGMDCALGADLSQGDDFCAFTYLFPLRGDTFGVKTRAYISERTYDLLKPAMKTKYNDFIDEGTLIVMPGTILDMEMVYEDMFEDIQNKEYNVMCIGYDPYNSKEFIEHWVHDFGEYGVVMVRQGVKTETIPLGELKKLSEDRKLLFDEYLMEFAMSNCVVSEDTNGNRKLFKMRRDEKIDNVSAMMDAYVAWKNHQKIF